MVSLAVTLLYLDFIIGFLGVWEINGDVRSAPGQSMLVNSLLILLFALQHTFMARKRCKTWIRSIVPRDTERTLYLALTSLVLLVLMSAWQPIPLVLFDLRGTPGGTLLLVLFSLGCFLIVASTFQLDHLQFFGLKKDPETAGKTLKRPLLYRLMRHPIYLGWLLIHWATPFLTVGHVLLALGMTVYIRIALIFEIRDLIDEFGEDYTAYMKDTPSINPLFKAIITQPNYKGIVRSVNAAVFLLLVGLLVNQVLWIRKELHMMETEDPGIWEETIEQLTAREDRENVSETVLFVGSSSFRFWDGIQDDLHPFRVTNFGFGGAKIRDVYHYRNDLIYAYQPAALVLFVGTNDLSGASNDKDAETVFHQTRELLEDIRKELPETQLYFLSITPTPGRWEVWPEIRKANDLIQTYARQTARVHFVDCTMDFLNEQGTPDMKYFRWDGIHFNKSGYALWGRRLKQAFQKHSLTALHGSFDFGAF